VTKFLRLIKKNYNNFLQKNSNEHFCDKNGGAVPSKFKNDYSRATFPVTDLSSSSCSNRVSGSSQLVAELPKLQSEVDFMKVNQISGEDVSAKPTRYITIRERSSGAAVRMEPDHAGGGGELKERAELLLRKTFTTGPEAGPDASQNQRRELFSNERKI
jgi:hypothetical protein